MLFMGKPVAELQRSDIEQLKGREREHKTMEFKRELPGKEHMDRFVATVASFANASGGHIVYGVEEESGTAVAIPGLSNADPDAAMLTLQNSLNDSIRPRVPGVEMSPIFMEDGTWVLVVSVPRSWRPPHMVTRGGSQIFHVRDTNGRHPMDIDEIRSAFLLSDSYTERMRRFVTERREAFIQGRIGPPPVFDSILFMHLVPLSAIMQGQQLDPVAVLHSAEWRGLQVATNTDYERLNLDGVAAYSGAQGETRMLVTHVQVFRNGAVELMSAGSLGSPDQRQIPSESLDELILDTCRTSMTLLTRQGIDTPLLLSISLVGVKGYRFGLPQGLRLRSYEHDRFAIDRDELHLPEIVVEKYGTTSSDTIDLIKPCMDALWQAAGHSGWLTEHICRQKGQYR